MREFAGVVASRARGGGGRAVCTLQSLELFEVLILLLLMNGDMAGATPLGPLYAVEG